MLVSAIASTAAQRLRVSGICRGLFRTKEPHRSAHYVPTVRTLALKVIPERQLGANQRRVGYQVPSIPASLGPPGRERASSKGSSPTLHRVSGWIRVLGL